MRDILEELRGGDRRSIGKANEVAGFVLNHPNYFKTLFEALYHSDELLRMRAADAIEKISLERPEWLSSYAEDILELMQTMSQQEVCWHMAQMSPRLSLREDQLEKLIAILRTYLSHKSNIVKVSALEALCCFAEKKQSLMPEVSAFIQDALEHGSPSLKARAKKLQKRMERKH